MKVDQLVSYLNAKKINLSPAFQRGHVWNLKLRQALVKNVLAGKPIPAVFFYKETSGASYSYNILDGKQRLETLILFIGNQRPDLKVENWRDYFFSDNHRRNFQFKVRHDSAKVDILTVDEEVAREFKEYVIPTIEITLDDSTSLDEIISLFVDINQQGVKVERFQIVKAMFQHGPLLKKVFEMVAIKQERGNDIYYKTKKTDYTKVLRELQIVQAAEEDNQRVDVMWERLIELALYSATAVHRKPTEILKEFIGGRQLIQQKLDSKHVKKLKSVFAFLRKAYALGLKQTRLAKDHTHFYTLATSLIATDLLTKFDETDLIRRLGRFADLLDSKPQSNLNKKQKKDVERYLDLSSRQTTDPSRRKDRGTYFLNLIESF